VIDIAKGKGVEIIATIGGAAATGDITAIIEYDWKGQ
jgi:hypothetical protein